MGIRSTWGILFLACSCGGSGGDAATGSGLTGRLELLAHHPDDGAVQVPLDSAISLRFDAVVVPDCLHDEDTWLGIGDGSEAVPGTFAQVDGGREVVFTPASPLQPETGYTMHVSPLTCDTSGRILETGISFSFRSFDQQSPELVRASAAPGARDVDPAAALELDFDEPVQSESVHSGSVYLRDTLGTRYPVALSVDGARVIVDPVVDLGGERDYVLVAQGGDLGIRDRAGNPMSSSWSSRFTTAPDVVAPQVVTAWPTGAGSASPVLQPLFVFDESLDPGSLRAGSIRFVDEHGAEIGHDVHLSPDRKTLRVTPRQPLAAGRDHTVALFSGPAGVADLDGNRLAVPVVVSFPVGSDATPPALVTVFPADGASRVSPNAQPVFGFSGPLDRSWLGDGRVQLLRDGVPVPAAVVLQSGDSQLRLVPERLLEPGAAYTVRVRGGHDGLRDPAGNVLAGDLEAGFTVSLDGTLPQAILAPGDGTPDLPPQARLTAVFDAFLDPDTVSSSTVVVTAGGLFVPGQVALERQGRVVSFVPERAWDPGTWYTVRLRGGADGIREQSGNWLTGDVTSRFRAHPSVDVRPPAAQLTLNDIGASRREGLAVPPHGFTIDVQLFDPEFAADMGSVEILLSGPGPVPDADAIYQRAEVGAGTLRYALPPAAALEPGTYEVRVRAADLSGNRTLSAPLPFFVTTPSAGLLPFERTQVVWVRFDLDRNGNGRSDFEDDLLLAGFATPGDPAGTNAWLLEVIRDGILSRAGQLFGRDPKGLPVDEDSAPVRLTHRVPMGVPHMQIAVGGFDPEGAPGRGYGDDSSGILGRALYDYRNGAVNERNVSVRPGLGVFPAEMFLFQARIHEQVGPSFLTEFGRRFARLVPQMGGVPAGSHALDPVVLAPDFEFADGSADERARYLAVFEAADDWATVIGVILGHEIGHSIGLVAPGGNPGGLHGDASLHNALSGAGQVMSSSLSYTGMVLQTYAFRDLNLAYLRQRVILR